MPRRPHNDDEFVPSAAVLRVLNQWLLKNDISRGDFGEIIGVLPVQVSRLFNRNAYLSRAHRELIEKLTQGEITAEMLVDEEPPPEIKITSKDLKEELEREFEEARESIKEIPEEESEERFDGLVKQQVIDALVIINKLMKSSKNDAVRFKCAEKIIDYAIGRPLRAEKKAKKEKEENDSELYDKLRLIDERLNPKKNDHDENSESVAAPSSEAGA